MSTHHPHKGSVFSAIVFAFTALAQVIGVMIVKTGGGYCHRRHRLLFLLEMFGSSIPGSYLGQSNISLDSCVPFLCS